METNEVKEIKVVVPKGQIELVVEHLFPLVTGYGTEIQKYVQ